jgi:glycosyltransferase involved in cell wall biosynthesis
MTKANSKIIVSCVTPTFNRANILPRAIESTINQTYLHWEMIIVDDGSEDNTEEVVAGYMAKDSRIRYFKNPGKGGNAARNYGIRQARGEWIAFLDDDDRNLLNRFERQLNAAYETGSNYISSCYFSTTNNNTFKFRRPKIKNLQGYGDGIPSRWLIKKGLLQQVNGFDESQIAMQDNELSFRLVQIEPYLIHNEYVSIVNTTTNSLSRTFETSIKGKIQLVDKHKDKMHPFELAAWYYSIARQYAIHNDMSNSYHFLTLAFEIDSTGYFKQQWSLDRVIFFVNKLGVKVVTKYVTRFVKLFSHPFPKIVNHRSFP